MGGQIVVDLHEPHSDQAVEPCVGHFLHDVLVGSGVIGVGLLLPDGAHKLPPLLDGIAIQHIRLRCTKIVEFSFPRTLRQCIRNPFFGNAHQTGPVADIGDQLIPCPDGKVFNGCFVHGWLPLSFIPYLSEVLFRSRR